MAEEEMKILIAKAASKALDCMKNSTNSETGEVLKGVMSGLKESGDDKIIAVAAASKAIQYKQQNIFTDRQILQKIMDETGEFLALAEE